MTNEQFDAVLRCVHDWYEVRHEELLGNTRRQPVALARQVAYYLAKTMFSAGQSETARKFHRDHAAVAHGIRSVINRIATDRRFAADIGWMGEAVKQKMEKL